MRTDPSSTASAWSATEPDFLTRRVEHYFTQRCPTAAQGGHPKDGLAPGEGAVMLCGNDYLSITDHPDIIEAQVRQLRTDGSGLMKATILQSAESEHSDFEKKMAGFLGYEDCLLAQSGYSANIGLMQSIADPSTPVYIDLLAHMSLWEGARAAGATTRPFRHNSVESLEKLIKQHGCGVIVIDSIYSTLGDIAPIEEIANLAQQSGCLLVVDESHSLATHGPQGRGLVAELNLIDKVHFITASLAKGFCGRGGIMIGSHRHIEYIRHESKPTIFSSAVLSHEIAAFCKTIDVVKQEGWRRTKVARNAAFLREQLSKHGYNLQGSQSQIIALEGGPFINTNKLRNMLEAEGIFGSVFWEPATSTNRSLLRLTVNAAMTMDDMQHVADVLGQIKDTVGMQNWPSTKRLQRTTAIL